MIVTTKAVNKAPKVPHHLTPFYCFWSNKEIERLGKEPVFAIRFALSDLQLSLEDWPVFFRWFKILIITLRLHSLKMYTV